MALVLGLALGFASLQPGVLAVETNTTCNSDLPGCDTVTDGGTGDGGGGSDTDRDWVFAEYTNDGAEGAHTFLGASDTGDITCVDDLIPENPPNEFRLTTRITCNDEFATEVAQPQIALVTQDGQPLPPCGEQPFCMGGTALFTVYGTWAGTIVVSLYDGLEKIETANVTLESRSYGLIWMDFFTQQTDDYTMEFALYDDSQEILLEQHSETIAVDTQDNQTIQPQVRAVEYTDPQDASAADYVFAGVATMDPARTGCLQVLNGTGSDATVLSEAGVDVDVSGLSAPGGADLKPTSARVSPDESCGGSWNHEMDAEPVPLGT